MIVNGISRFNRGLRLALHRFSLFCALLALLASGASYVIFTSLFEIIDMQWHFLAIRGLAIIVATFWFFLGSCIIARYCFASANHQPLQAASLMRSIPALATASFRLCMIFAIASSVAWLALMGKYVLMQLPFLGTALSIVLAWVPFFMILLLKIFPWVLGAVLYLVVPMVAVQGHSLKHSCLRWVALWKKNPMTVLICTLAGLTPLIFAAWLVSSLQRHTMLYLGSEDALWVLMMRKLVLSFAAAGVLAPALALFTAWGMESLLLLEDSHCDSSH